MGSHKASLVQFTGSNTIFKPSTICATTRVRKEPTSYELLAEVCPEPVHLIKQQVSLQRSRSQPATRLSLIYPLAGKVALFPTLIRTPKGYAEKRPPAEAGCHPPAD